MTRLYIALLAAALLWGFRAEAQDPVFSQFYASPLQLNPAFTGTTAAPRVALNYRNQWPNLAGFQTYVTYAASYEQLVPELNSGFGLLLMSDNQAEGTIRSTQAKAVYSYVVRTRSDWSFRFGVNAGLGQAAYDWDRFVFLDQIDPINGPVNPSAEIRPDISSLTYFDAGAGILAYSSKFYAGLNVQHLNRPDVALLGFNSQLYEGLPMFVSLHTGMQFTLREGNNRQAEAFISPNLLYIQQGDFGQVNGGAYLGLGNFFGGLWYRHAFTNPDAVIVLLGVQKGVFKFGYSYDITVSSLDQTGGAHEISMILNFENSEAFKNRRRSNQYNDCFQFFR